MGRAIADLRFETAERVENSNLTLDWPIEQGSDNRLLTYETYRNLTSSHREVVSNIPRHARATSIQVRVETTSNSLCMTVQDDGIGMIPQAPKAGAGRGLRNIQTRLSQIDGACVVESNGRGTCVSMSIPII